MALGPLGRHWLQPRGELRQALVQRDRRGRGQRVAGPLRVASAPRRCGRPWRAGRHAGAPGIHRGRAHVREAAAGAVQLRVGRAAGAADHSRRLRGGLRQPRFEEEQVRHGVGGAPGEELAGPVAVRVAQGSRRPHPGLRPGVRDHRRGEDPEVAAEGGARLLAAPRRRGEARHGHDGPLRTALGRAASARRACAQDLLMEGPRLDDEGAWRPLHPLQMASGLPWAHQERRRSASVAKMSCEPARCPA
mmetsp:Transcript_68449/g.178222  ORF Transcript_68449/g.178222 Transcript_68449/m.178222 type:complete len:248 (+) Transcript_68449:920-1663(+)